MTSFQNSISSSRPAGAAPQRIVGFILAAGLNAAIAYILLGTLGMVPMPTIPKPIDGSVIIEPRDVELPPPPQPTIPPPRIQDVVPPIIEVPLEPEGRNVLTVPDLPPSPRVEPTPQAPVERPVPPPVVVTPPHAIMATHTIP